MGKLLTEEDVFPWVERKLGGEIVASQRQGGRDSGGRPGWFIDFRKDGNVSPLYIRADRGEDYGFTEEYGLQREAGLLRLLDAEGIPVPKVVASCDAPSFLVMEFLDGRNDIVEIDSAVEMDSIAKDFARIMADWHAIPAEKVADLGFHYPTSPDDLVGHVLDAWERGFYALIKEPVPLVTFACQWLRRHPPPMPERMVLVQGDTGPGQFLFKDGKVQAVIDWETATLGDPMRELAHIRTREAWYPTGNLPSWFQYYSQFSGRELDEDRIRYYSVLSMLIPALALGPVVQHLNPRDEHCLWLAQDVWSKRETVVAIAEVEDVPLPSIELPAHETPRLSRLFDAVTANLTEEQLPHLQDPYLQHRMKMTIQLVTHLRNVAEIGNEIDELELDDMKSILGWRPANVSEGHRAVDELVRTGGPELDHALIGYFHRHSQREEALLRGAMGRAGEAVVAPLS